MKRFTLLAVVVAALAGTVIGSLRWEAPKHEAPRSPKWPALRKAHLLKEPACVVCGRTDDLQVHHVIEFRAKPELELDPANLVTLCGPGGHNHHLIFGHLGNFMYWNPDVREDAKRYRGEVEKAKARAEKVGSWLRTLPSRESTSSCDAWGGPSPRGRRLVRPRGLTPGLAETTTAQWNRGRASRATLSQ